MYIMSERLYLLCLPVNSYKYGTIHKAKENTYASVHSGSITCVSCDAYQPPVNYVAI